MTSLMLGLLVSLSLFTQTASAERIRDLTTVQGVRDNALIGYG
ncbi:MAG: flagellar basal body P-ring protein FlgI, partial [Hafnia sp.]